MTKITGINHFLAKNFGITGQLIAEKNGIEVFYQALPSGLEKWKSYKNHKPFKAVQRYVAKDGTHNIYAKDYTMGGEVFRHTESLQSNVILIDIVTKFEKFRQWICNGKCVEILPAHQCQKSETPIQAFKDALKK